MKNKSDTARRQQSSTRPLGLFLLLNLVMIVGTPLQAAAAQYSLAKAISVAQAKDPWLVTSQQKQVTLESQAISAATLPDPKVNVSFANLPTDNFDFSRENMTQFKLGVSQQFPRGDSTKISSRQLQTLAGGEVFARQDREATVAVKVATVWLDAYHFGKSLVLLEHLEARLKKFVSLSETSYETTSGKLKQADILAARVALLQLNDRKLTVEQNRDLALAKLTEWLEDDVELIDVRLIKPNIPLLNPSLVNNQFLDLSALGQYLVRHPRIMKIESKVSATQIGISLAKQNYKPQIGVEFAYGYRDSNPLGQDRSDLFTFGVSMDLPLFTSSRQDKLLKAAVAENYSEKSRQTLVLREMRGEFEAAASSYRKLKQREMLYQNELLPALSQFVQASFDAYTNSTGDLSDLVNAQLQEESAEIDNLAIEVDIQKRAAQLNYFLLAGNSSSTSDDNPPRTRGKTQ